MKRLTSTAGDPSRRPPDPRPACPVHAARMLCQHTGATKRYYYCRVAGCGEAQAVPRWELRQR